MGGKRTDSLSTSKHQPWAYSGPALALQQVENKLMQEYSNMIFSDLTEFTVCSSREESKKRKKSEKEKVKEELKGLWGKINVKGRSYD